MEDWIVTYRTNVGYHPVKKTDILAQTKVSIPDNLPADCYPERVAFHTFIELTMEDKLLQKVSANDLVKAERLAYGEIKHLEKQLTKNV